MPQNPHPQGLPARRRVRRAALFQEAYAQGHKTAGRTLVVWRRSGPDADLRLGVVASRKVGNSVARSRAKRRIREWFRRNRHRMQGCDDVIVVARRAVLDASADDLSADAEAVFSKCGLLPSPASCPTPSQPAPPGPPSHE